MKAIATSMLLAIYIAFAPLCFADVYGVQHVALGSDTTHTHEQTKAVSDHGAIPHAQLGDHAAMYAAVTSADLSLVIIALITFVVLVTLPAYFHFALLRLRAFAHSILRKYNKSTRQMHRHVFLRSLSRLILSPSLVLVHA